MPASPAILIVGLPWDHPLVAAWIFDPIDVRDGLASALQAVTDAGYTITPHWFGPDSAGAAGMPGLVALLKANDYDAVIIGAGVRLQAKLTEFFEEIVNTVKEHAPRARMGFNSSPQSTLDAVKRACPLA
ncbi:hypothetical protein FIBSPDRAFT_873288 [Athelia psychrophila]|uniref:Uncharacterized protein n=1 Tax=Athelia psychrophila TaxID=1759441 RepID=A0A165YQA7_9AGAM|nr:hypothetical protein FIBSPDRAFT_873288 [Fibularhizoctonia sp. CBS 109695]